MPAGRVFVVMLVCLLLWAFLFGPTMKRAAEASPAGARRTVALAVLAPFVAVSDVLQITRLTDAVERAFGRNPDVAPGGEIVLPPEPIPSSSGGGGHPKTVGPIRVPTGRNKLRVVVVGDSLASGLGFYLERVLNPGLVRVSPQGRISTGLARPDYFDWTAAMTQIVDNFRPDLVVIMLGENDDQPLRNDAGQEVTPIGTNAWPPAYRQRVTDFMSLAASNGARVIWVGLPNMRDPGRRELILRQDRIFQQAAHAVKNAIYLDTYRRFSTPSGGYTAYLTQNGTVLEIREADGVHFNSTGYALLARDVALLAERKFELTPKAVTG